MIRLENGTDISWTELLEMPKQYYTLIDLRSRISFDYGSIPGAVNIPYNEFLQNRDAIDKENVNIIYCMNGMTSREIVDYLVEHGITAYNLKGGYQAWLVQAMGEVRVEQVELSIRKKFHKSIFSKFAKAIKQYELLKENDKVAVCISGGKDSMLMAKCFQEIQRHRQYPFELVFLVMDPGYNSLNRQMIENNARIMGIPLCFFETKIFDAVDQIEKSPCYLCARMRRGYLYSKAKELGCNKIALGHHYDDVIETILMGMLYGGQVQTMMPKLHSTNFEGMELIRPLYFVREEDIKHWRDYNELHFIQCACHFVDTCTSCNDGDVKSKRQEIKLLIRQLKENNPYVESNIFKSVENVNLNTIIAYKQNDIKHHFLESYNLI